MSDPSAATVQLRFRPTASKFISTATAPGTAEAALFGPRGEGKTWAALGCMLAHAQKHAAAGHAFPTRWLGVADTFESHKRKTFRTLEHPAWGGIWRSTDGGHVWLAVIDGATWVELTLIGVHTQREREKLRTELHGVWFEEPAPAASEYEISTGIDEHAWMMALSSLSPDRLPSYHHPAIMTLNYPDADHWTWARFVEPGHPRRRYFRIPGGERMSQEARAKMAADLAGDPGMLSRLFEGEPAAIMSGTPVAKGYNAAVHVAQESLPIAGHEPLILGWDGYFHAAVVIAQRVSGRLRVLAGLYLDGAVLQLIESYVLPWFEARAPWILERRGDTTGSWLRHYTDPTMDTPDQSNQQTTAAKVVRSRLGGALTLGAVRWPQRIGPVMQLFNLSVDGKPVLQIDPGPDTYQLRQSLAGRWHYPKRVGGQLSSDLPAKPDHPWEDYGDAFCYLVGGAVPSMPQREGRKLQRQAGYALSAISYQRDMAKRQRAALWP